MNENNNNYKRVYISVIKLNWKNRWYSNKLILSTDDCARENSKKETLGVHNLSSFKPVLPQ